MRRWRKLKSWWSNPLQRLKCPTGKPFGGTVVGKKPAVEFIWRIYAVFNGAILQSQLVQIFFPSTRAEQWVVRARVRGRFFPTTWGNQEAQNTQGLCFIFTNDKDEQIGWREFVTHIELNNAYKSGMTIILEAFWVSGSKEYSGSWYLWLLVLHDIIGETVP